MRVLSDGRPRYNLAGLPLGVFLSGHRRPGRRRRVCDRSGLGGVVDMTGREALCEFRPMGDASSEGGGNQEHLSSAKAAAAPGPEALCEFRCQQCGWVDTRPDKCTNCGSLREQERENEPYPEDGRTRSDYEAFGG